MKTKILILAAAALLTACTPKKETAPTAQPAAEKPDAQKLVAKWLRPDGGYILDIKTATPDGKLDAAYLNPNPINVSRADWRISDQGLLIVAIELRDANYPGATYTLRHDKTTDQLIGSYHQPLNGQTYEISFERMQP